MKIKTILVLIVAAFLLFGCTQTNVNNDQNKEGRTVLAITDAASDMGAVSKIQVTVSSIEVYNETNGWVSVSTTPKTYDLLDLKAQNKTVVLSDTQTNVGNYSKIRLNVSKIIVTDSDGTHEAAIPKNQFEVSANIKVGASGTAITTLDFLADESLHTSNSGDYVFAPVIQVESKSNATVSIDADGSVSTTGGTVETSTKVGMDIKGNVAVGASIPVDTVISTVMDDSGKIMVDTGLNVSIDNNSETMSDDSNVMVDNTGSMENNTEVFSEFKSLITGLPEYEITYTITSGGYDVTTTQYLKNDKMRADTTSQGVEAQVYLLPTGQYSCTNAGGSWMCIDFTETAGASINNGFEDAKTNPDAYASKISDAGTKTVLGQVTTCFELKDSSSDYTYCLNAKGAPLYMEGTSGENAFKYEATAYNDTVADSVFTLPAEPGAFSMPDYSGYN